ncbi:MAG: hypothetical protein HYV07_22925 [Deltaproteobacteria bacterium]|nr:hypothetical protein [Deltaproteobacteria bacterium]
MSLGAFAGCLAPEVALEWPTPPPEARSSLSFVETSEGPIVEARPAGVPPTDVAVWGRGEVRAAVIFVSQDLDSLCIKEGPQRTSPDDGTVPFPAEKVISVHALLAAGLRWNEVPAVPEEVAGWPLSRRPGCEPCRCPRFSSKRLRIEIGGDPSGGIWCLLDASDGSQLVAATRGDRPAPPSTTFFRLEGESLTRVPDLDDLPALSCGAAQDGALWLGGFGGKAFRLPPGHSIWSREDWEDRSPSTSRRLTGFDAGDSEVVFSTDDGHIFAWSAPDGTWTDRPADAGCTGGCTDVSVSWVARGRSLFARSSGALVEVDGERRTELRPVDWAWSYSAVVSDGRSSYALATGADGGCLLGRADPLSDFSCRAFYPSVTGYTQLVKGDSGQFLAIGALDQPALMSPDGPICPDAALCSEYVTTTTLRRALKLGPGRFLLGTSRVQEDSYLIWLDLVDQ